MVLVCWFGFGFFLNSSASEFDGTYPSFLSKTIRLNGEASNTNHSENYLHLLNFKVIT